MRMIDKIFLVILVSLYVLGSIVLICGALKFGF